jgi:hypothetical protein
MFYYCQPKSGCPHKQRYGQGICYYALLAGTGVLYIEQICDYKNADQENYYNFQEFE